MAKHETYGKDNPERFISGALTGGSGPSRMIKDHKIGRGQEIKSAYMLDNVGQIAGPHLPDEMGGKCGGSDTNLAHSLQGVSSVGAEALGTKGKAHGRTGGMD